MSELTKADVEHVKKLAGDYEAAGDGQAGLYTLATCALKIGIFLLIRALEDTTK